MYIRLARGKNYSCGNTDEKDEKQSEINKVKRAKQTCCLQSNEESVHF